MVGDAGKGDGFYFTMMPYTFLHQEFGSCVKDGFGCWGVDW